MTKQWDEIPFNDWSLERIKAGKKHCTSRNEPYHSYDIPRRIDGKKYVLLETAFLPLWFIREHLFALEGADSPEEFEKVWKSIYRGNFKSRDCKYVHFFGEVRK